MKTYSKKDIIPVGGIMERKSGKMYECLPFTGNISCEYKCAFTGKASCHVVKCVPHQRDDGDSVYFVRRQDLEATAQAETKSEGESA